MPPEVAEASARRLERTSDENLDGALGLLLSNYQAVTANPRSMGYLRFLLAHYAKSAHPWHDCYKDNFKRFGPKTAALCGVLKDTIRQRTDWRGKGPRPTDVGSPGVAIADADAPAAPPFGGRNLKLEIPQVPDEVWAALEDVAANCNPCRVLLGLEDPPHPSEDFLALAVAA